MMHSSLVASPAPPLSALKDGHLRLHGANLAKRIARGSGSGGDGRGGGVGGGVGGEAAQSLVEWLLSGRFGMISTV